MTQKIEMRRHTPQINTGANKTDVANVNNIKRTANNLGNFSERIQCRPTLAHYEL